jgi:Zn-finger nucleic acid-binding protein
MTDQTDPTINCPKCNAPMRQLKAGDITVDRCESCFGLWLDQGERLKLLKDKSLVAGVDVGDKEVGAASDEITEINCPRCGEAMRHITDRAQKHIGFEFCRECKGSFLDAGELRDLSEFSLSERIKAMFGR